MRNFNVTKEYNRNEFKNFLQDFLSDDYTTTEEQVFFDSANIDAGYKLGESEKLDLTVYEFVIKSSHDPRVTVTKEVCTFMKKYSCKSNMLASFYSEKNPQWRLSLITTDFKYENGKIQSLYSNPRRYSFLLGPECKAHTPETMFAKQVSDTDDLKKRFSVDVVTKEFYKDLFNWYEWASTLVEFPQGDTTKDKNGNFNIKLSKDNNSLNLIRLITRLMFVWFIKQKDLIPSWIFDINELKNILVDFDPNNKKSGNYYNAIIQNLFFATLNRKIEDRAFADDKNERFNKQFGVKNYYRDNCKKTFFKKTNKEIIDYFKSVPFLNGGLFECLDTLKDDENKQKNIEVFRDGFSREPDWMAFIPNHLFWQEDDGEHEGLIHILNRYNFTVEENTPSDVQIALDPELLGKVFENLLGTYNPETSETARKDSGSFYTPREIVDFMVDESLKAYLLQNVKGITDEQTKILFDDNADSYDERNKEAIITAVRNVKILDPACGSGAFPMGALHRMVQLVKKCDGIKDDEKSVYQLKLSLIENCLYGVDIQPIAVQICKLRFFISLICEEKQNKSVKENYGISHLPNLETKFVAANTLIGLKKEETMMLDIVNEPLSQRKKELSSIRAEHFKASTPKEKYECRKRDREKRQEIIDILERQVLTTNPILVETLENDIKNIESKLNELPVVMIDGQAEQTLFESEPKTLSKKDKNETERKRLQKQLKDKRNELESAKSKKSLDEHTAQYLRELAEWDPYDQNAVSTFFNPEWMFNVKDGFNIVIGNPPYISTKGIPSEVKKMYESEFGFSDDTYNLFTFKGLQLAKKKGTLTYIIPKTFWTTQTKRKMRDLILGKNIKYIFDTGNPFEDVMVDSCIIHIENSEFNDSDKIKFLDGSSGFANLLRYEVPQNIFIQTQNSVIFKPTEYNMKIYNLYGKKVKELYDRWWDKIETSKKISENAAELKRYRDSLKPGDIALLGCLTEGGVGLQTGDNGKYIAVRKSTKWAANVLAERPYKLMKAMQAEPKLAKELGNIYPKEYLASLSEIEIAEKFDSLKEKYGRNIFGKGFIYRIIDDNEIADVETLTDDEKINGIDKKKKFYVPYDKGDKDGNRWYLETPFAIAWSKENVRFLKTDTRARYQGYTFFFKEGFCWTDVNSTYLKSRLKKNGVFDVLSMSLFSLFPLFSNWYYVCLINSKLISVYVANFINNTSHFQINDARQLPIIIPEKDTLKRLENLFNRAVKIKKSCPMKQLLMKFKQK